MFGNQSFLVIGGGAADIMSLVNGGYEISDCSFAFEQGVDERGKATTRVYSGAFHITLSRLPDNTLIEWALNSRKYCNGFIVVLDANNIPVEKFIFMNAACVDFSIDYTQQGDNYTTTKLVIQAERIVVGDGIEFENEWKYD